MRSFFFSILVAVLFTGFLHCAAQSPKEFNKKIEESTTSLYSSAALWGSTFISQYNGDQDYGKLKSVRADLQDYIEEQLTFFKEAENVGGSEKLKQAVIAFFEYEKELVKNYFTPFEKLNSKSDDEQVNTYRSNLREFSRKEAEFTQALNKERKEYAAKNNFSIEPPPQQAPHPPGKGIPRKAMPKRETNNPPAQAQTPPTPAEPPRGRGEPPKKVAPKEEDDDKDEE